MVQGGKVVVSRLAHALEEPLHTGGTLRNNDAQGHLHLVPRRVKLLSHHCLQVGLSLAPYQQLAVLLARRLQVSRQKDM